MAFFSRKKEEKEPVKPEKEKQEKVEAVSRPKEKQVAKKEMGKALGVLVKPLVTEKVSYLSQYGQYGFEVSSKANKIEIAKAVERAYGVKPVSINIIRVRGKNIRSGKTSGMTKKWKKAIVTLKPGDKIELHEGV